MLHDATVLEYKQEARLRLRLMCIENERGERRPEIGQEGEERNRGRHDKYREENEEMKLTRFAFDEEEMHSCRCFLRKFSNADVG